MPEIHRPDFASQNSGGNGDSRSLLVFIVLFFLLLFGYPYVHRPTPSAPVPRGPVRSHTLQTEIVKAPVVAAGHSSVSADHFGWLAFIARPLYLALQFLHGHGVGNWGWDIIVLTAMFNMVAVRPRILSMKSSLKMMPIQPKVDAIKQR